MSDRSLWIGIITGVVLLGSASLALMMTEGRADTPIEHRSTDGVPAQ